MVQNSEEKKIVRNTRKKCLRLFSRCVCVRAIQQMIMICNKTTIVWPCGLPCGWYSLYRVSVYITICSRARCLTMIALELPQAVRHTRQAKKLKSISKFALYNLLIKSWSLLGRSFQRFLFLLSLLRLCAQLCYAILVCSSIRQASHTTNETENIILPTILFFFW